MKNVVFEEHDGDLAAPPPGFDLDPLEWDERLSPLRIRFHNDDLLRRGREFLLASTQILPQASKPQLPMYSISLRTTWIQALILILRGLDHGVRTEFDDSGRLLISGYALFEAGLISAACKITCALLPGECEQYGLGTPPTNSDAIDPVLLMYMDTLKDAKDKVLRRNYLCAVGWLMASGKINVVEMPPDRQTDSQQELVN